MNGSVEALLRKGKELLEVSGAKEISLDCQLFMMKATGLTKVELFTKSNYVLTENESCLYFNMVEKKKMHMPTQYILGRCEFMGLVFLVNENVLIPRSDTEILVETVLRYAEKEDINSVIDIGTGSGCISVSLKKFGIKDVSAVDISEEALAMAKHNAKENSADIKFIKSDLFKSVPEYVFDAVVSNPPYIERDVITELSEEVKGYEPVLALDGGIDGLDFYKKIIEQSKSYLRAGGRIFFEIGYNQSEALHKLMKASSFKEIETIKDLAGLDRVVTGIKVGEV